MNYLNDLYAVLITVEHLTCISITWKLKTVFTKTTGLYTSHLTFVKTDHPKFAKICVL